MTSKHIQGIWFQLLIEKTSVHVSFWCYDLVLPIPQASSRGCLFHVEMRLQGGKNKQCQCCGKQPQPEAKNDPGAPAKHKQKKESSKKRKCTTERESGMSSRADSGLARNFHWLAATTTLNIRVCYLQRKVWRDISKLKICEDVIILIRILSCKTLIRQLTLYGCTGQAA